MTDNDVDHALGAMAGLDAHRARGADELRSPSLPTCPHFSEGWGCTAGTPAPVAFGQAVRVLTRDVARQAGVVEGHADDPDADEVWTALHSIAATGLMLQSFAAQMAQVIRAGDGE